MGQSFSTSVPFKAQKSIIFFIAALVVGACREILVVGQSTILAQIDWLDLMLQE